MQDSQNSQNLLNDVQIKSKANPLFYKNPHKFHSMYLYYHQHLIQQKIYWSDKWT